MSDTHSSEYSRQEVLSEGTGESEGNSSRGEGSRSESVMSDTHSSEYSETTSGDISWTEHNSQEMESNKYATDTPEESETGISENKRKAGEGEINSNLPKRFKGNRNFSIGGES